MTGFYLRRTLALTGLTEKTRGTVTNVILVFWCLYCKLELILHIGLALFY